MKTSSHSDTRHQKGRYEPLDVIVGKEGGAGNPENIEAARKYAIKRLAVGKQYIRFNSWTERLEFLYVKHGQDKLWKETWEISKEDVLVEDEPDTNEEEEQEDDGAEDEKASEVPDPKKR